MVQYAWTYPWALFAEKQVEKTKKEEATKAAEAERAAKQAQMEREAHLRRQIIEQHPAVQRLWPHALYHLDYEQRSHPQAVDFQLNSSLPKMLANERNRLLEKCRYEWANRITSQLNDTDGNSKAGDVRTARTSLLVQQRKLKLLGLQVVHPSLGSAIAPLMNSNSSRLLISRRDPESILNIRNFSIYAATTGGRAGAVHGRGDAVPAHREPPRVPRA